MALIRLSMSAIAVLSLPANAQLCEAPREIISGQPNVGDTCSSESLGPTVCGDIANPGPNIVFEFSIGGPTVGSITLESTTDGFAPVMYLLDATEGCGAGPCAGFGDTQTPITLAGLAPGNYWLVIAAAHDSPQGACGQFQLDADATLVDTIFADGFDAAG